MARSLQHEEGPILARFLQGKYLQRRPEELPS